MNQTKIRLKKRPPAFMVPSSPSGRSLQMGKSGDGGGGAVTCGKEMVG